MAKDSRILLYTGRLSPDKNIGAISVVYDQISKDTPNVSLLLSYKTAVEPYIQHLLNVWEPKNIKILHSNREQLKYVYSAADLFVSCATDYFETFGLSPLEANACGVPAVVPNWVGFNSYMRDMSSNSFVDVDFFDEPLYNNKDYAMVNLDKFVSECEYRLENQENALKPVVTTDLEEAKVFERYRELVESVLNQNGTFDIDKYICRYTDLKDIAAGFLEELKIKSRDDVETTTTNWTSNMFEDFNYKSMFYKIFYDKANL